MITLKILAKSLGNTVSVDCSSQAIDHHLSSLIEECAGSFFRSVHGRIHRGSENKCRSTPENTCDPPS